MRMRFVLVFSFALIVVFALPAAGQSSADLGSTTSRKTVSKNKKSKGPGKEVGEGSADIGKGAAKGAGDLAKGTAGGAADLATGHPMDATVAVGKGAAGAGGHVAVGSVKGVAKIGKGVGGLVKRHGKKSSNGGDAGP